MTSVSTMVSRVIVGPKRARPFAMLCLTSSWVDELKAYWANREVFDRSISRRKKKRASLINGERTWGLDCFQESSHSRIQYTSKTYLKSEISLLIKFITLELKTKLENTVKRPAIPENQGPGLCIFIRFKVGKIGEWKGRQSTLVQSQLWCNVSENVRPNQNKSAHQECIWIQVSSSYEIDNSCRAQLCTVLES